MLVQDPYVHIGLGARNALRTCLTGGHALPALGTLGARAVAVGRATLRGVLGVQATARGRTVRTERVRRARLKKEKNDHMLSPFILTIIILIMEII